MSNKIIIGNCSGFYGDRLSAAKDMVEGGPIDVLTGDYLAELTMTILYGQKIKRDLVEELDHQKEKLQEEDIKDKNLDLELL